MNWLLLAEIVQTVSLLAICFCSILVAARLWKGPEV